MKISPVTIGIVVALAIAKGVPGVQAQTSPQPEQADFCEDTWSSSAPLPLKVVTAIMNTSEGREAREEAAGKNKALNYTSLFEGTLIRLAESHEHFYFVMGSLPMSGADNTWFWLVRDSGKYASVLLFCGGNCLSVEAHRTLGFRDVTTVWSSPQETITSNYRFDDRIYRLRRKRSSSNIPGR